VRSRVGRYIAEVKTGRAAVRLDTAATRRQLLEYRVAFDVDGVLLVDAEAGEIRLVEFPLSRGRPGYDARALGAWATVLAALLVVFALLR
jgi:hypothetical protein